MAELSLRQTQKIKLGRLILVSIRVSDPYDSISTLLDLPLLKSFQSSDVQALRRCCDLSPQGIENRGVPP